MQSYQTYRRGQTPFGAIVVELYVAGETVRGFLRQIQDVDEDGTAFPSEELEPEVALRLAENKRQENPSQPIFIELAEGVEWTRAGDRSDKWMNDRPVLATEQSITR